MATVTEDDDEAVSALKRTKTSDQDADSGSSSSSLPMYEETTGDLADTAAEKFDVAGSSDPRNRDGPVLMNS